MNILFLCTGSSTRSILYKSIPTWVAFDRFRAFSAGSNPKGTVHPLALELLQRLSYPTVDLRSKSWEEFTGTDTPNLDVVITVCDYTASEVCPAWTGQPISSHWSIPDPVAVEGTEAKRIQAFASAYEVLLAKITALVQLPTESLSTSVLKLCLDHIMDIPASTPSGTS